MLEIVLILNATWFALGFISFYLRREVFAKILVSKEHRNTPVYDTLVETGRFMGGFNFAFSLLNVLLLFNIDEFQNSNQWAILLAVVAVAHGSQFAGNVPMALRNLRGQGNWNVFKGVMLRIFVVDFALMTLNAGLAVMMVL